MVIKIHHSGHRFCTTLTLHLGSNNLQNSDFAREGRKKTTFSLFLILTTTRIDFGSILASWGPPWKLLKQSKSHGMRFQGGFRTVQTPCFAQHNLHRGPQQRFCLDVSLLGASKHDAFSFTSTTCAAITKRMPNVPTWCFKYQKTHANSF